jgi:hypothetical protein
MGARAFQDADTPVFRAPQGVLALINQAWNLVRLNLKDSFKTILLPALLFSLSSFVLSVPFSLPFLTEVPLAKLTIVFICMLAGILLWLVGVAAWIFSYCALSRLYSSAITDEKPYPLHACWRHALQNWKSLVLTLFLLLLLTAVLIALDFILLSVGFAVSAAVFTFMSTNMLGHGHNPLSIGMSIVFLLIWGFSVLALLVILITVKGLMFIFPFTSIATHPDEKSPWWPGIRRAFRLVFSNFTHLMLFGIFAFIFACVLSSALHTPVLIWSIVETARISKPTQHQVPLHVQVVFNAWTLLSSFILLAFYSSAFTLAWHDCRVRKEGLDLKLWLYQLMQRRGISPKSNQKGFSHE